jgi:hypothetical protein
VTDLEELWQIPDEFSSDDEEQKNLRRELKAVKPVSKPVDDLCKKY